MRSLNFRRSKRQRKLYGVPTSIVGLFLVLIVLFVFLTVISYLTSELPGNGLRRETGKVHGSGLLTLRRTFIKAKDSNMTYHCAGPDGRVGLLNDDFCDCQNGVLPRFTDEPATSACSHVLTTRTFFCGLSIEDQNKLRIDGNREIAISSYKHWPKLIFSSRVHDGVCDCCGGEDEVGNPHLSKPCPNLCEYSAENVPQVWKLTGRRNRHSREVG